MKLHREWLKLHNYGWLTGSIRSELSPDERSVFIDLLCVANLPPRLGYIERTENMPYELPWLANYLVVPLEIVCSTILKCVLQDRIEVMASGVLRISNWDYYQNPNGAEPLSGRELELHQRKQLQRLMATYEGDVMDFVVKNVRFINQDTGEILPYVPYQEDKVSHTGRLRPVGSQHVADRNIDVVEPSDNGNRNDKTFIDMVTGKVRHPTRTRKSRIKKRKGK